jgi:hypothetical protein
MGSHVLANIVDVLLEAGPRALALMDDGLWSGWSVGWPLFRFHADQVQHRLYSFFHRFTLQRQVLLFLHQCLQVCLGVLAHDYIRA